MKELPSSDAETDRMEGMDERESELEALSGRNSDEGKLKSDEDSDSKKRGLENDEDFTAEVNKKMKTEFPTDEDAEIEGDEEDEADLEDEKRTNKINSNAEGDMNGDENDTNIEINGNAEGKEDEDKDHNHEHEHDHNEDKNDSENEREENRIKAMNGLKNIEILFAKLKDKLYETQLKKLQFELKLCQDNKHPDLIDYIKMADEDFNKKSERLMNLQKYRLKCLDNQTRAYRVQIHQQFIKNTQNLGENDVIKITKDWYDINKERRMMDLEAFKLPDYYQYNKSINHLNIEEYLPNLILQRNEIFKELSCLQGMINYKQLIPSSLNYLKGCNKDEINSDLKDMGL